MRTRESGMPEEPVWSSFFDPEATLRTLGVRPQSGDVVDFGCGYGTFAIPAAGIVTSHREKVRRVGGADRARRTNDRISGTTEAFCKACADALGGSGDDNDFARGVGFAHERCPRRLSRVGWTAHPTRYTS